MPTGCTIALSEGKDFGLRMFQAIIFDLDGVLVDSRPLHFHTLNAALAEIDEKYVVSEQDHANTYDGLSTKRKLELLTAKKGLPEEFYDQIWAKKQKITLEKINEIDEDQDLIEYFNKIQDKGIRIGVASNSVRKTLKRTLLRLGVIDQVDLFLSNEDVESPKPNPEIYWESMKKLKSDPENTVIFEDSHIGRAAAISSGAHLIEIENRYDLSEEKINSAINYLLNRNSSNVPWKSKKLNVLIPMAGSGKRFKDAGFTFPKPLIEVNGKPMIQLVVENLNIVANFIFIVLKEHFEEYQLKYLLNLIAPNCKIVQIDSLTDGAASTTLFAKEFINNDDPLLIANSDQFVKWNSNEVLYAFQSEGIDGGIVTFNNMHPKWSYARLNEEGFVAEIAEKKVISNLATVGIYYWKSGADYLQFAEQMIRKDIRTNNEFYVAPVFNEAIASGKRIRATPIQEMWGLGTPEDLNYYLTHHKL